MTRHGRDRHVVTNHLQVSGFRRAILDYDAMRSHFDLKRGFPDDEATP